MSNGTNIIKSAILYVFVSVTVLEINQGQIENSLYTEENIRFGNKNCLLSKEWKSQLLKYIKDDYSWIWIERVILFVIKAFLSKANIKIYPEFLKLDLVKNYSQKDESQNKFSWKKIKLTKKTWIYLTYGTHLCYNTTFSVSIA